MTEEQSKELEKYDKWEIVGIVVIGIILVLMVVSYGYLIQNPQ